MKSNFDPGFSLVFFLIIFAVAVLVIWLQGKAMWRAARNGQSSWFVALLVINTAGILPAIYLLTNKENKPQKAST